LMTRLNVPSVRAPLFFCICIGAPDGSAHHHSPNTQPKASRTEHPCVSTSKLRELHFPSLLFPSPQAHLHKTPNFESVVVATSSHFSTFETVVV
jgi:hypothetical protein